TVRPQVEHIITMSDVVKCSDEDAQWLYPRLDLDELAGRWLGLGASIVVVTRGPRGATAWSGPDRLDVPGKTLQVADTIGAGDSFSGGIIDALRAIGSLGAENRDKLRNLGRAGLEPILHQAISVSAITVSRPGADPPHRRELPEEHRLHGR
ncbi:MAG: carbohydrate kinase, partial [Micrococcales bacterium]